MLANRIERLMVKNYRSLGDVSVDLSDLTVLVGPNGSGKSNLLDALMFIRDASQSGINFAINVRGSFDHILSVYSGDHPEIELHILLTLADKRASYKLILAGQADNTSSIEYEEAVYDTHRYVVRRGQPIEATFSSPIAIQENTLLLPLISKWPEFAPLASFLTQMQIYYLLPDSVRRPQAVLHDHPLNENGQNLLAVIRKLINDPVDRYPIENLSQALAHMVPDIDEDSPIDVNQVGRYLAGVIKHNHSALKLDFALESDGTLRALAILTALNQNPPLMFMGFEEPEIMLYPNVIGIIADEFLAASTRTQVVLTTHSPDLISRFSAESLRMVERVDGLTHIGTVTKANKATINDQLFSSGDLLRIGGLQRGE